VTNEHWGKVRGAQLCKGSKAGAASVMLVLAKMGQPPIDWIVFGEENALPR
jgi:hypothetical protein